jgi:plasmid rolling circle replication initiator protein Rep
MKSTEKNKIISFPKKQETPEPKFNFSLNDAEKGIASAIEDMKKEMMALIKKGKPDES